MVDVELDLDVLCVDAGSSVQRTVKQSPVQMRVWHAGYITLREVEAVVVDACETALSRLLGSDDCLVAFELEVNTEESCLCLVRGVGCLVGRFFNLCHNNK